MDCTSDQQNVPQLNCAKYGGYADTVKDSLCSYTTTSSKRNMKLAI